MKIIHIIWVCMFLYACKAQKSIAQKEPYRVINLKGTKDVVITSIINGTLLPFYLFYEYGIEEGTHFADLSPQATGLMDLEYNTTKYLSYFNGEKDMEIECHCPMRNNYYLKNLNIKEGKYTLEFKKDIKIKGAAIPVSDTIQNILFQKIRPTEHAYFPEDIYFKDLNFTVIDMADTLNVKLVKEL